ncbi:type II secretion system minor pseudopilin GspJ [Vibrio mimicus]|uniref:type II secretion system minor pseudopilin GspJ n=1 Tax=Vibrio mimicus TaxID=674 RepID=UPI0011D8B75F|nr:type II secretion system minor pseudopilin GspJ [Vibrio mimicus]TXY16015.1 type II secretion system protein GspJ [Vibrio mimicus]
MWRTNQISTHQKIAGFTLIEVLVAIAIFASLSIGAYQVLNQVQRSNEISAERTARLAELQRAIVIMDSDFRQIALRQFRTNGEAPSEQLLQGKESLLDSDQHGLLFTRLGWHNPQQQFPRGEVVKVGYRLYENRLERIWWRYPDTPAGQEGFISPLLSGVEDWKVQFYFQNEWSKDWVPTNALPEAVKVTLKLQDYGEIERIYLTGGGSLNMTEESVENGG